MIRQAPKKCPVCGSGETNAFTLKYVSVGGCRLAECRSCGIVYTLAVPEIHMPENVYSNAYYGRGASKFLPFVQMIRDRIMRIRAEKYLALLPGTVKRPRILDVGCAEGRLLRAFLDRGCECWGIEHSAYPEKRFLLPDRIVYMKGNLCEIELPKAGFDLIFLWHVLEHLEETENSMRRLYEILRPNGFVVLALPNFESLERRAFKGNWFHLDLPWHKTHFTPRSLRYLLEKTGFHLEGLSFFCLEQGPYGLVQSSLNAMGWPRNELYESIKGSLIWGRHVRVFLQASMAGILLFPALLATWLAAKGEAGPVLLALVEKKQA